MTDFYELLMLKYKNFNRNVASAQMTLRCFTPVLKCFYMHGHTVILTLHLIIVTSYDNLEHAA